MSNKRARLDRVHRNHKQDNAEALERLRATGANYVPGRGALDPVVVLVGEAPGAAEDRLRQPFCGPSGNILDELLESVNLLRTDVYITNIVKYRPPDNRDPFPSEKAASLPFLWRELAVVGCPWVVTLGRHAMRSFLGNRPHDVVRGVWRPSVAESGYQCQVLPLYHPAVAIYSRAKKPLLLEEFQAVLEAVDAQR